MTANTECQRKTKMILAFDPGLTTGWAQLDIDEITVGQISSLPLTEVYEFLRERKPIMVLNEKFKHRPQLITAELYPMEVIGVIHLWCQQNDVDNTSMLPAQAKAFWTDDKIKALDLWTPGLPHGMDALRVLLAYRSSTNKLWYIDTLRKLKDLQNLRQSPSKRRTPKQEPEPTMPVQEQLPWN